MWDIEGLPTMAELPPADRLWVIALAMEEAGGPVDYVWALRDLGECLGDVGWWLAETTRRGQAESGARSLG